MLLERNEKDRMRWIHYHDVKCTNDECLYMREGWELPRTKKKQGKSSRMFSSILYKEITKEREEKNISLKTFF